MKPEGPDPQGLPMLCLCLELKLSSEYWGVLSRVFGENDTVRFVFQWRSALKAYMEDGLEGAGLEAVEQRLE